jgi:RimJ/RimL family protein N-acetyltransferase
MAMAVVDNGEVVAGVVFYDYDADAGVIQISGASDNKRWMTRPVLWAIYNYVFNELKCQAAVQRNDPDNTTLAAMMPRYGFKRYDIPRLRGRDKAEALFILGDDDWRGNGFHKENENG